MRDADITLKEFFKMDTYTRELTNYNVPAEVEKLRAASRG
jgi:hypothetical protein